MSGVKNWVDVCFTPLTVACLSSAVGGFDALHEYFWFIAIAAGVS